MLLKSFSSLLVNITVTTAIGRYFLDQVLNSVMSRTYKVRHQRLDLTFTIPNSVNYFRINTFSSKEPETLEWIDGIPKGSVVWDIGANVGLYSCYAAKARECEVFAFEPSVFNLELLARNVFLNNLTDKVVIVPLPLCEDLRLSTLNMTSVEWGGALSSFGKDYGWDGKKLRRFLSFGLWVSIWMAQIKF